mgnify:CR=1 FL=1
MRDSPILLEKIRSNKATWEDYQAFLDLEEKKLNKYLQLAQNLKEQTFGHKLKIYIPNKAFPAISITGTDCELHCEHCNKKYLKGMIDGANEQKLEDTLLKIHRKGGNGALISGGCLSDGSVPLLAFLDVIKRVKERTDLIINVHTGLLNEETAKKLAEAHVDIVSFDVNMDEEIIHNIYHLDKSLASYEKAVEILERHKLNIIPHLCIGLHYGVLHKELESLKFIQKAIKNPSLIVLIALIPPQNTNISFETPKPLDIAKVAALTRFLFPSTEISLGCMRPRGKIKTDIEKAAIKAGVTRMEIPSPKTLKWLQNQDSKARFEFYSACCAIPSQYESLAKSKDSDIKRYLKILK